MSPLVELVDVSRFFRGVAVLQAVSLQTEPGQVVAIYGRSGSGKTTLLNLVGGLDQPDGGTVRVAGTDLATLSPARRCELRRTQMGLIFQSYGLLSHLSARENVELGLRLAACPGREWRPRAEAALAAVGLAERARHRPAELSGGERQRVAIARVLATRPRLILADEPTAALDHNTGLMIIDLLVAHARETGANVWIATHDGGVGIRVDTAYHMTAGRLAPREG